MKTRTGRYVIDLTRLVVQLDRLQLLQTFRHMVQRGLVDIFGGLELSVLEIVQCRLGR